MENPNNETPKDSLLESIIEASKQETQKDINTPPNADWKVSNSIQQPPEWPKKVREPMSIWVLLKGIASMLFVALIFFWSFLAYVVFNPGEAQFFVTVFGIDPADIANILKKLINGSFGVILLALSIVWITTLFRAIWTPKELKRKRMLSWLFAGAIGIILFGVLTFWSYLFKIINTTNFTNPGGNIIIYDQDLLSNASTTSLATISDTTNLIGPITLKFDISENALQVSKSNFVEITHYDINFDGAICNDGTSVVGGSNPADEKWIICTFDTIKPYNIRGTYATKDRLGKTSEIPMNISPVEVRWILDIRKEKNTSNNPIVVLDAKKLLRFWSPRWIYGVSGKELEQSSLIVEPTDVPTIISLKLFWSSIDRIFVIQNSNSEKTTWTINITTDPINPLAIRAEIQWLDKAINSITKIEWWLDDGSIICKWSSTVCEYSFWTYWKRTLTATLIYGDGQSVSINQDISIDEPIRISRHVVVRDSSGNMKNPETTFDSTLWSYIIKDLVPPETLTLDAQSVVTENPWYTLDSVLWTLSNGKTIEEKKWERINFEISGTQRYVITWLYTFIRNGSQSGSLFTKKAQDSIIIDTQNRFLIPKILINKSSDYVPTKVTVDGSQSRSENGEIKKFIYDFGDGKPVATGDAIQEYEYTTPGERDITLTIINSAWETATVKQKIVLKDTPKSINFTSSMSPGITWTAVDFSAENTTGQIEDYVWSFWDNTPSEHGYSTTHVFQKSGRYTVLLTVIYVDGTQKQTNKLFEVIDSLE